LHACSPLTAALLAVKGVLLPDARYVANYFVSEFVGVSNSGAITERLPCGFAIARIFACESNLLHLRQIRERDVAISYVCSHGVRHLFRFHRLWPSFFLGTLI
jgi:hypothetical protein